MADSEDDDTSDDGGGASEAAQHLEEVYSRILKALHKTAKIMCTGYEKATGDMQGIVQVAVQEVTWPNKTYICNMVCFRPSAIKKSKSNIL